VVCRSSRFIQSHDPRRNHACDQKDNGEVVNNVHVRPHQLIAPFVSVPAVFLSSERRV
jgi:hypothetical protein